MADHRNKNGSSTLNKMGHLSSSSSSNNWSLAVQRQICEFEASDFALPTGEWPYSDQDMGRLDASKDTNFYDAPRFVTHIDDRAISSLRDFYREEMAALALQKQAKDKSSGVDILDLCSSWISHLPEDDVVPFGRVMGVGMNEEELQANPQLTEYFVQDLNDNPQLSQFEDQSFDVICNVVSVDYLTRPRETFQEMHRILRPGGLALMSFSNRCFPTKAVQMWLNADDIGRMTIVGSYFHYSASWSSIEALDIIPPKMDTPKAPSIKDIFANPAKGFAWMTTASSVQKQNSGDPMYVVKATK
mmetsp:Transcript_8603/g.11373  ORF Transcript_8603/g.11373 Transcript_8603/m.11373 type:complete len:302 (+) Transcript_8603:200-1105(+)